MVSSCFDDCKNDIYAWIISKSRVLFATIHKVACVDVLKCVGNFTGAVIDEAAMVLESQTHIVLQVWIP